jgi:hypothetical protein
VPSHQPQRLLQKRKNRERREHTGRKKENLEIKAAARRRRGQQREEKVNGSTRAEKKTGKDKKALGLKSEFKGKKKGQIWKIKRKSQSRPIDFDPPIKAQAQIKAQLPPKPSPIRIGPPKYPKPTLYMHPPHPRTVSISSAVNVTVTYG